jgi:hypothetical protein
MQLAKPSDAAKLAFVAVKNAQSVVQCAQKKMKRRLENGYLE